MFGNTTEIGIGNRELASYTYHPNNGKLETLTYGNGLSVKYFYDDLDRIVKIDYNIGEGGAFETVYEYTYNAAGQLLSILDHTSDEGTVYIYDSNGKMVRSYVYDLTSLENRVGSEFFYDEQDRLLSAIYRMDFVGTLSSGLTVDSVQYRYVYDDDRGDISGYEIEANFLSGTVTPEYDLFGRTDYKNISFSVSGTEVFYQSIDYTYITQEDRESLWISSVTSNVHANSEDTPISSTTRNYAYDDNGNITEISDANGTVQYKYYYDSLGQLIREDNRPLNYSYTYSYDNAGNITSKKRYAFTTGTLGAVQSTTNYTYGNSQWKDLLTQIGGNKIEYDEIGNPVKIGSYNASMAAWNYYYELKWEGRELQSYQYFEYFDEDMYYPGTLVEFTYNVGGIRTSKTVNGAKHEYILNGTQIIAERFQTETGGEYEMCFIYDEKGAPIALKFREKNAAAGVYQCYFFEKNLQGDVVAIYNAEGEKICSYTYDAWGNCTTTITSLASTLERNTVCQYNPFRYRGYYFDTETGLYYLQSRYYNPSWGRFINADSVISGVNGSLHGCNAYAYCFNNPVNMLDSEGNWPEWMEKAAAWVNDNIIEPVEEFVEDVAVIAKNTVEFIGDVVEDIKNYDSNNKSEDVVLESNYFSNYNGAFVIKTPFDSSFSFGVIGLSSAENDPEVLKHEYGHIIQFKNMGIEKYFFEVAIPSVTINLLDRQEKLPYDYYSYPWEAEANQHGKSTLTQGRTPLPEGSYTSYRQLIELFFD